MTAYVELQVTSNFSFLRGASHPGELAAAAALLGHPAIALTDRNSLAGVVRAHVTAKDAGIRLVVGARLDLGLEKAAEPDLSLLCYPTDRAAYGRLSRLISLGRRRAPKGECWLTLDDVLAHDEGQIFIVPAPERSDQAFAERLRQLARRWPGRCHLAAQMLYRGDDRRRLARLAELARVAGAPLVASNDVHYHVPERRVLQDVLTCIREHCTLETAGFRLLANAERHLKPAAEMLRLFKGHEDAVARTAEIAERCRFRLDELRYEYPAEPVPEGSSPQQELERLTWAGAAERYGGAVPGDVRKVLEHELRLIARLGYAPYFLTVHDIVRFARSQGILCQGRGSAANSVVCYVLGITAVDPVRLGLLFERFVSAERNEPPDIDVDFEHERREEVIQHIYKKYGRDRAGLAATVIHYRARSAIREVGKALGLSLDTVGALADGVWGWSNEGVAAKEVREAGLDPEDRTIALALRLTRELIGFPRHLSQHVGGFVITRGPLEEVVPVENAAMKDRTIVEWDKDDLDALGILKIDVLGLGMLTCLRKGFALLERHYGRSLRLGGVPAEDPAVYEMLSRADSIGVFQVESRAQMSMLPRLKPRNYYDLVIEVAIVRPGPIQGDMVHPYLRRRDGREKVEYPKEELRPILQKTLGVPLFQEQAMRIAMVAAGFTAEEADRLRRAMAAWRRTGTIHAFGQKMIDGMRARGYELEFAARCFAQIQGFGEYGFPESHAASFALLVYDSAWLKCHYPAVFACALLNSQPMGFYAPAQIVRDAREHGVEVRPVDVNHSDWDCTLELVEQRSSCFETPALRTPQHEDLVGECAKAPHPEERAKPASRRRGASAQDEGLVSKGKGSSDYALRLGFRQIKGFPDEEAKRLVARRGAGYRDPQDLWRRAGLKADTLERLAHADAWRSAGLDRRQALWALKALSAPPLPLFAAAEHRPPSTHAPREPAVALPAMPLGEQVVEDYAAIRMSLKAHPLRLLRARLEAEGVAPNRALETLAAGRRATVAGLVLVRQRPGTANGVIFITLEDETGIANLIVWPSAFERHRRAVLTSRLLLARGTVQREGIVVHLVVERLVDASDRLDGLGELDGMEPPVSRADEVKHPGGRDPRGVMPRGRNFR